MHITTKFLPLYIPINNYQKNPIFLCGFNFLKANNNNNEAFGLKRNISVCAVDKDPEFEFDPDKAREALRKLDDQIQTNLIPKIIREAADVDLDGPFMENEKEESLEIPGSLLASLASALLIFSIFYNILFITVIQPSIDNAP